MNQECYAFLRMILDHPEDDTSRLIYSDWLEEQGEIARAEFIRTSIQMLKVRSTCGSESGDYFCRSMSCPLCPLIRRMNAAWLEFGSSNYPPLDTTRTGEKWMSGFARRLPYGPDHSGQVAFFNRGFVSRLRCTIRTWLDIADSVTAHHPIQEVMFMPHPQGDPLPFTYEANGGSLRIGIRSKHGMSTVVPSFITLDEVDETIMQMFKRKWPRVGFSWNAFSMDGSGVSDE